jgi:hypothetical protein
MAWTSMDFPGKGNYPFPHGLVPVAISESEGE